MNDPSRPEETENPPPDASRLGAMAFAGARLAGVFAILLAIVFAIYAIPGMIRSLSYGDATVSIGFLLVAPFCTGAVASLLTDPAGVRDATFHALWLPLSIMFLVVLAGGMLLREGVICVVMLVPVWLTLLSFGGFMTHSFHKQFHRRGRMNAALLASLAALASALGPEWISVQQDYRFERTIIIHASPDVIWPHLESLTDISQDEGNRNITQDLLAIPRPVSARLEGKVRYAEWQDGVRFEEHILNIVPDRQMEWAFIFPDPSLQNHVDRHIDPNGQHLKVRRGGYLLEPLEDGSTRVTLYTTILLDTQLNPYPAMWAGFILGDIQGNILEIVRARAEAS
jgi:hypothetical protein